jgi:hypothetical protein
MGRRILIAAMGFVLFVLLWVCLLGSALANDSSAELMTGGLVFTKNNDVEMLSEDLSISTEEIRVSYRFLNRSAKDVTTTVAFPLPDLKMDPDDDTTVIPTDDPVNFVGFVTIADGQPVHANVDQRVYLGNREETGLLTGLRIPLSPYLAQDVLEKLSPNEKARLRRLGLINENDIPLWTLKTTFYWEQRFAAGRETVIEHRYKPSVGTTVPVGGADIISMMRSPELAQDYRKYCLDSSFLDAVASAKSDLFSQQRIEYVLKTGSNWSGPVQRFRLVVDKGAADNLVSFCGQGVRRIGPTQFEMTKTNFVPQDNLAILILKREPQDNAAPPSPAAGTCDDLWHRRNSIFKDAGYCFKTPRAISVFGNAGCQHVSANDVPLSDKQRQTLDEIKKLETANRCR